MAIDFAGATDPSKKKPGWEWIEFAADSYGLVSPGNKVYGSYKYLSLGKWEVEIYRSRLAVEPGKLPLKIITNDAKEAREYVETACLNV